MTEYIERKKAVEWFMAFVHTGEDSIATETVISDLKHAIPTADVAPVRHGRWKIIHRHRGEFRKYTGRDELGAEHTIVVDERYEIDDHYCPECGKLNESVFLNFCPNCGAKMIAGNNE